ncbi:transketolase family protein [Candidatus Gracilibacteria bacterium]|nr:transketolase family protein [Candidatus Gracilibacteria bacterium]
MIKAVSDSLVELARNYSALTVFNADFSKEWGLTRFAEYYGEKLYTLGLSEGNIASVVSGFALRGKMPFVFLPVEKCYEQIRNSICVPNLNVKIVGIGGLGLGEEGVGRQSLEDVALMRALPNMKVYCPCDYDEAMECMKLAAAEYGPCYIRLAFVEGKVGGGVGVEVLKKGSDVCVFVMGGMVGEVLKAAELSEKSVKVVKVSVLKPIDSAAILECAGDLKCFSVEDHSVIGGLGDAVMGCGLIVKKLGMEGFGESGKARDLRRKFGLHAEGIAERLA